MLWYTWRAWRTSLRRVKISRRLVRQARQEYRDQNGRFKTAEDLLAVKGIGQATVAKNKDRIVLD